MSKKQQQYTYRNTSELPQALIGVGVVEPGETFSTFEEVTNPNFTLVTTSKKAPDEPVVDNARPLSEDAQAAREPENEENK